MTSQSLFGILRTAASVIFMVTSAILLAWIVLAATVFLLIPWDVGIPPAGSFAQAVNDFFESDKALFPATLILLCEIAAFARGLLSRKRIDRLVWRFTRLNVIVVVACTLSTAAGMLVARFLFPNRDPFVGDQSYGVALVYWGLVVVSGVLVYVAYRAWTIPPALRLKQSVSAQP
jgi:hypothetical protein